MSSELEAALQARIRSLGHSGASVTGMEMLTGGASRQMWRVATDAGGEWSRFVLRRDHPSDPAPDANTREALTLIAAHAAGAPCPSVLDHSSDPAVLGTPYLILGFVEGETIARKILRDERFDAARARLPRQLGDAIGTVHGVSPEGLPLPLLEDAVASLRDKYAALGVDRPALLLGLRELDRRRPEPAPRRTLVHGDFRLGNLMVDESGLAAILDWEIPHVGDPIEDLGYICMRAWRFGGPGRVAGVGDAAEFLDAYADRTGFRPSEEQLTWWEAKATATWGIGCLTQLRRSVPGHTNELELLAIGRRTAEQEHDLLELLYPEVTAAPMPDPSSAPGRTGRAAGLYTQPSSADLLQGLERFLDPTAEVPRNDFKLRVAKNVVSLLRREQEWGPVATRWYADQLARLGLADESAFAERVRNLADTSAETPGVSELVAVLKTAARLRLEVSNPKYLQNAQPTRVTA
ncbi:phosphotransferase [Nocardioides insulae]|uniref:phosphotransferase n=1 Tax=Nocardioides insulae TaxID=394734 RepID=UPI00040A2017|nr:phosphotransferase [Nocardioides insulae]